MCNKNSTFIVEKNGYAKDKINIFYNGMKKYI